MKNVCSIVFVGLCVLSLTLSVGAQQSQQPGTTGTTGSQQPSATGTQPGTTGTTESQQPGTAQMQQEGAQSISATVTKVDQQAGIVEVQLSSTQKEASIKNLRAGDMVTIQMGSAPGTMEKGGTTGTSGATQQQQKTGEGSSQKKKD